MAAMSKAAAKRRPPGRLRRALPVCGQVAGALTACVLWTGVASPSLQLLLGLEGLADESVAISLQSAVLGIDDVSGRPAEERARAAAAVLGLSHWEPQLSSDAARASSTARSAGAPVSSVVRLATAAAGVATPAPHASAPSFSSRASERSEPLAEQKPDAAPVQAAASASVCSISGSLVSFTKQGNCVVRANQAGNVNHLPAPQVQQTIVVLNHA